MADVRRFELDEIANRPGTYFNPTTEVVIVVDDSASIEAGLLEEGDEGEWILLGDEPAVDEHRRDELIEAFETGRVASTVPETEDEVVEEEDQLEPDADEEDL